MKIPRSAIIAVLELVMGTNGCRKAQKILSPDTAVTATSTKSGRPRKNAKTTSILLMFGRPNYECRKYIKLCKAAGELFPVRRVRTKWYK